MKLFIGVLGKLKFYRHVRIHYRQAELTVVRFKFFKIIPHHLEGDAPVLLHEMQDV